MPDLQGIFQRAFDDTNSALRVSSSSSDGGSLITDNLVGEPVLLTQPGVSTAGVQTANSTALSTAWTAAKAAGHNTLLFPSTVYTAPYYLDTGLTIDAHGAKMLGMSSGLQTDGYNGSCLAYSGAGILFAIGTDDRVTGTDGAMNGTTGVLTSASGPFTAGHVGKTIGVNGAGAAGIRLYTTIASRQSATQVTLTDVSATLVSGATFVINPEDVGLYSGYEGTLFDGISAQAVGAGVTALDNGAGNYVTSTIAIADYRGGRVIWGPKGFHCTNFDYAFYGFNSDLDNFMVGTVKRTRHGIYLGPRSDQCIIGQGLDFYKNDQALELSGVTSFVCGPKTSFVDNGSGSVCAIKIHSSNWQKAVNNVKFDAPHCESLSTGTSDAMFDIGSTDETTSLEVEISKPHINTHSTGQGTPRFSELVKVGNVSRVRIERHTEVANTLAYLYEFVGTSYSSMVFVDSFSAYQTSSLNSRSGGTAKSHIEIIDTNGNLSITGATTTSTSDRSPYMYTTLYPAGNQAPGGSGRTLYMLARANIPTLTNLSFYLGAANAPDGISLGVYSTTGSGLTLKPNALLGGRGLKAARTVTDAVTNGTSTVTSATGAFTADDVGKHISGTDIPANTSIGRVNSSTSIGLSSTVNYDGAHDTPVVATGSGTGRTHVMDAGIMCPTTASVLYTVPLLTALTLDVTATYYFALGASGVTTTFGRLALVAGAASPAEQWQQVAFPCPDPAASLSNSAIIYQLLGT